MITTLNSTDFTAGLNKRELLAKAQKLGLAPSEGEYDFSVPQAWLDDTVDRLASYTPYSAWDKPEIYHAVLSRVVFYYGPCSSFGRPFIIAPDLIGQDILWRY